MTSPDAAIFPECRGMASGRVGSWGLYDFCDRMGRTGAWLLMAPHPNTRGPTMLTSGCVSILLTAMLAWSPPGALPRGRPGRVQAPGLPRGLARLKTCATARPVVSPSWGSTARWRPLRPEARRACPRLREESGDVLRRQRQPAGCPLVTGTVRQGATGPRSLS